jgi:hypothetical protein
MRRQHAAAALIFTALSIAMTWPLARILGRAVADPGDPLITIWILDWDFWATLHQPLQLFHANTFHPAKFSLAFSENLYGLAILLFPLRLLGVNPIVAHNIALLAGFAFCGFAAYLLGRRLTDCFAAGIAAGVFYAFVPFRFVHLSHLQHIWGGWLPMLLFALLWYADAPTRKRAIGVAAVFVMNGLTNIHYLFFGSFAIAVTAVLLLPRRAWRELVVPMIVAFAILAPFLYPYFAAAQLYGMQRGSEEVWRLSATLADWLLPGLGEPELKLYPGALALLITVSSFYWVRNRAKIVLAWLWILIGVAGSLGLHFFFHEFLFGAVPGFRAIRVPARWAVIAYVGMSILIALFTAAMRWRWLRWLAVVAFVATLWQAPIRWYLLDPATPPVYEWLAKQHVSAIAEMPIVDDIGSDYASMLYATVHHQPMVNGISGFSPPVHSELARLSSETPISDAFVDALKRADVELVIVHPDRYGARNAEIRAWLQRELDRGRMRYVARFDARTSADWVFSLRGGAGPRPQELGVYLAGGATCTSSIAGVLENTKHGTFRGWVSSPNGIASVDLWFENRGVRHRATLTPLPPQRCGQPVRFELTFPSRPSNIRRKTDVQVEVIDKRGRTAVLDDRWLPW